MSEDGDQWSKGVLPFVPRPERNRERAERVVPAPVLRLPSAESSVDWAGDEVWLSTLPDPHDTTRTEGPEDH